jgi:hypothetical protein
LVANLGLLGSIAASVVLLIGLFVDEGPWRRAALVLGVAFLAWQVFRKLFSDLPVEHSWYDHGRFLVTGVAIVAVGVSQVAGNENPATDRLLWLLAVLAGSLMLVAGIRDLWMWRRTMP